MIQEWKYPSFTIYCCDQYHDQKQHGKEKFYLSSIFMVSVHFGWKVRAETHSRDLEAVTDVESIKELLPFTPSLLILLFIEPSIT